jgi:hypothetical protein
MGAARVKQLLIMDEVDGMSGAPGPRAWEGAAEGRRRRQRRARAMPSNTKPLSRPPLRAPTAREPLGALHPDTGSAPAPPASPPTRGPQAPAPRPNPLPPPQLSGGDRGGTADLIATIKVSKIPIICIANDKYQQKLKSLKNHLLELDFRWGWGEGG